MVQRGVAVNGHNRRPDQVGESKVGRGRRGGSEGAIHQVTKASGKVRVVNAAHHHHLVAARAVHVRRQLDRQTPVKVAEVGHKVAGVGVVERLPSVSRE